jgi:hypothetical protein
MKKMSEAAMARQKKNRAKPAVFYPTMLTKGEVDDLIEAGFLPVTRWVRAEHAYRYDNPRTYRTHEAKAVVRKRSPHPYPKGESDGQR